MDNWQKAIGNRQRAIAGTNHSIVVLFYAIEFKRINKGNVHFEHHANLPIAYCTLTIAHSLLHMEVSIQVVQLHLQILHHAAMGAEKCNTDTDEDQDQEQHDQQARVVDGAQPAYRTLQYQYNNI